ncbi:MAG: hypothetical protein JO246_05025 [Frankiaceae bacterium]|nr:hypothetical protein [Frankiaceae bacterium]MBV9873056.1 hypothetical protein [Frankiaceae bacterium]
MTVAADAHHHPHSQPHAAPHRAEILPEASGPGSVVLDIGGDIGAAAVQVPIDLDGSELEIRRVGEEWAGVHVAVRERPVGAESIYAALFPELVAGDYEVRVKGDDTSFLGGFHVTGGQVAQYLVN